MNGYINLPRSVLCASPNVLWVYANLVATADVDGHIEIKVSRWCCEINMTRQQLRDAINYLTKTNKITTKATNKITHITICDSESYNGKPRRRQPVKQPAKQPAVTDKISRESLTKKTQFDFVDPMFEDAFLTWIEYKEKELNERYKTERTLKAAYKRLVELSGYNPCIAMQIVEQSMAGQWKGLFELKTNGKRQRINPTDRYAAEREANSQRVDRGLQAAMELIAHENNL